MCFSPSCLSSSIQNRDAQFPFVSTMFAKSHRLIAHSGLMNNNLLNNLVWFRISFFNSPNIIACIADIIQPWLVNVFQAVLITLLWALNRLNKLPQECFEFPFIWIGKCTMAFLTGYHSAYSNPVTQLRDQNKDFGTVWQTDLTRV